MNITVVGAGYVGLANGFMIGITDNVIIADIDQDKIEKLRNGISPINDEYINKYIHQVNVKYEIPSVELYENSDIIFIATNTDYDDETKQFNLRSIDAVVDTIAQTDYKDKVIVIKSTIPIDYSKKVQERLPSAKVLFSPEFLRESFALYDNLHPDRIVIGADDCDEETVNLIYSLLHKNILKEGEVPFIKCSTNEAEVVKLFANTYLAVRIAFVNELDTFCHELGLDSKNIIEAIGHDHRIGLQYFNPSFGFGGYCLPKDTKQLRTEFENANLDSLMIANVYHANELRIQYIADQIEIQSLKHNYDTIGIYRVVAKKGINNYRSSAIVKVLELLVKKGLNVVVYEPFLDEDIFCGANVIKTIDEFTSVSNLIVANRIDKEIENFNVFTRDVFEEN